VCGAGGVAAPRVKAAAARGTAWARRSRVIGGSMAGGRSVVLPGVRAAVIRNDHIPREVAAVLAGAAEVDEVDPPVDVGDAIADDQASDVARAAAAHDDPPRGPRPLLGGGDDVVVEDSVPGAADDDAAGGHVGAVGSRPSG